MKRHHILKISAVLATVTAAILGFSTMTPSQAKNKLKVGFVYVGPIGDHGWSYQHDQGRLALEKALGNQIETTYLENITEGPDAERAIERLVRKGAGLVFTTSFGFMNPTLKVAKKYPNVKFEHATGYKRADNVATYSSRFYEGRYIMGQIAAQMSKSGIGGYVASFPIPEVIRGINAFLLGAQSINPNFKLKIIWVNSWFDPGKEADATKVLINQNADIITQHTDSTAPLQIAEQNNILGFGQATNMISFAPKTQLTSLVDDWSSYYIARTKAVLDGSWKSLDSWGGISTGMVGIADFTNMPEDVKKAAEITLAEVTSGKRHVFQGPIYKQDGSLAVAQGSTLSDDQLLGMNWYIKGIEDKLEN